MSMIPMGSVKIATSSLRRWLSSDGTRSLKPNCFSRIEASSEVNPKWCTEHPFRTIESQHYPKRIAKPKPKNNRLATHRTYFIGTISRMRSPKKTVSPLVNNIPKVDPAVTQAID